PPYGYGLRVHAPGQTGYGPVQNPPAIGKHLRSVPGWRPGQPVVAAVSYAGSSLVPDGGAGGGQTGLDVPPGQVWADAYQAPVVAPTGKLTEQPNPADPDGPPLLVVERPLDAGPDWQPWVVFRP